MTISKCAVIVLQMCWKCAVIYWYAIEPANWSRRTIAAQSQHILFYLIISYKVTSRVWIPKGKSKPKSITLHVIYEKLEKFYLTCISTCIWSSTTLLLLQDLHGGGRSHSKTSTALSSPHLLHLIHLFITSNLWYSKLLH